MERPDAHYKRRKRGPRSLTALERRRRRADCPTLTTKQPGDRDSCQTESFLSFESANFSVFHCNVNGFRSHADELDACLELLEEKPTFVVLNETKLNKTTSDEELTLTGYTLLSRRDRRGGQQGGSIACFVRVDAAASAVLLRHSEEDERS